MSRLDCFSRNSARLHGPPEVSIGGLSQTVAFAFRCFDYSSLFLSCSMTMVPLQMHAHLFSSPFPSSGLDSSTPLYGRPAYSM